MFTFQIYTSFAPSRTLLPRHLISRGNAYPSDVLLSQCILGMFYIKVQTSHICYSLFYLDSDGWALQCLLYFLVFCGQQKHGQQIHKFTNTLFVLQDV